MKVMNTAIIMAAATFPAGFSAAQATSMEGHTLGAWHYHGTQPDSGTYLGPIEAVVGPGVELANFGVTVFVLGEPVSGWLSIDYAVTNVIVALNVDQPNNGYWDIIGFNDTNDTLPPFDSVTINAKETTYAGFNASDVYVADEYFQINLTALDGLQGQQISLDITFRTCLGDMVSSGTFAPPGDGAVDAADLAYLLSEWGGVSGDGSPADIVTSATFQPPGDGLVDAADLAFLLGAWGTCP